MKQTTINLYTYDELSPTAQAHALSKWNENNDDPLMQSHMINLLKEKLDERKIEYDTDSIDVRYSLSHSQGDGFMFEGTLNYKGNNVTIEHVGRHCHSNSKQITWLNFSGEEKETEEEKIAEEFEKEYQEICKEMERIGYSEIEYAQSEEAFRETCEANNYTFEADGTMRNI